MKLYFSTIRIALPNTEVLTYWESGHPDEYDVQELFARSARYHTIAVGQQGQVLCIPS